MKFSRLVVGGFLLLICDYRLARSQDLSDLSLASEKTVLTPLQGVTLENAIVSLPPELIRIHLKAWIETATSGNYGHAMNAVLAILCAAMRSDGWEIISDRYAEILDLIHSPYPNVRQRSLLVAVHQGIREPGRTALALQSLISRGATTVAPREGGRDADSGADRSLRASAVQELLRLKPGSDAAHDAIDGLLSEDLSVEDRLMVIQSLADEHPASERTLAILLKALDNGSPVLREGAVRSLERLSDSGSEVFGRAGVRLLQMSSDDPEPRVREAAKDALGHPPGTHAPLRIGEKN